MPPSSRASRRLESGLRSLRWIVKLSGTRSNSSLSLRSLSSGTAVSTLGLRVRSSSPVPVWGGVGAGGGGGGGGPAGAGLGGIGVVARLDLVAQIVVGRLERLLPLVVA